MRPYEYWEWTVKEPYREWLTAWLDGFPFIGVEETPEGLRAYIDPDEPVEDFYLPDFLKDNVRWQGKGQVAPQNWNQLWERNFSPVAIDDLIIHAPFHAIDRQPYHHHICIDPAMAFGTGHHPSTRLMLRLMRELPLTGKRVIDWGCGTGILAIYAEKLGARTVWAIDNYDLALENTRRNITHNDARRITVLPAAKVSEIPPADVILANIERNTLLTLMDAFSRHLRPGGHIAFSGILRQDRGRLHRAARQAGFRPAIEKNEEAWHAFAAIKDANQ